MNPIIKIFTSWAVPVVLVLAYLFLVYNLQTSLSISLLVFAGGAVVMCVWFLFRGLAAHAAISRGIAIGEPDEVVARARAAIDHRFTRRAKLPFRVYEAIGLGLRGQWEQSLEAIDAIGAVPDKWRLLAGVAQIAAATELADAAKARKALDEITPLATRLGRAADLTLRECRARVRFVEGDLAGAGPLFRALADDIRLGPAPRAAALYYAARCTEDTDEARTLYERAMGLAPKTWIKAAASDQLYGKN